MTAIYIGIAILLGLAARLVRDIRRAERMRHDLPLPRCEGCDCPGRCEAAALVRRTLSQMGMEVEV